MVTIWSFKFLDEAVINQVYSVFGIDKNIVELNVIMDHSQRMNTFDNFNELGANRYYVSYWKVF